MISTRPRRLAVIFDLVRAINTARDAGVAGPFYEAAQRTLRELAGVLGLTLGGSATETTQQQRCGQTIYRIAHQSAHRSAHRQAVGARRPSTRQPQRPWRNHGR